jgi:hypothetical protein
MGWDFGDVKADWFFALTQALSVDCLKAADANIGYILINADKTTSKGFRVEFYKGTTNGFHENKCLDVAPGLFK